MDVFCSPGLASFRLRPLGSNALAERVGAFVARFGRLQDTLAGALLPRCEAVLGAPTQGYTRELLAAVPRLPPLPILGA